MVAPGNSLYRSIRCLQYTNKNLIRIVSDDGTGTSYGRLEWARNVASATGSKFAGVSNYVLTYLYDLLHLVYRIKVCNFSVFSPNHFFDSKYTPYYKIGVEAIVPDVRFEPKRKYVIYLEQPFTGKMKEETDVILSKLFNKLSANGYNIYIKQHPRQEENYEMGYYYFPKDIAIEAIVLKCSDRPQFVLGWDSSALFTLAGYWEIECYTLCDLLNEKTSRNISNCLKLMKKAKKRIKTIHYGYELYEMLFNEKY